jgi:hypothetical protein
MKPMLIFVRSVGLGTALLCGSLNAQSHPKSQRMGNPIRATFCEIAKNPAKFNGKEVRFDAQYEGPWVDSSALVDMNCSDVAIAPDVPHSAKGADALRDAYKSGNLGTLDKEIDATWTGTFFWRPGQMPSRLLKVHVIENLSVSKK